MGARTATTMAVGAHPGAPQGQGKNLPLIAMAHEIPYVATATVADLRDLEAKVEKAMSIRGARYLHVLVPCPLGWGAASHDTIKLARLARETGIFPEFEAERGEVTAVTKIRHHVPVEEYLKPQKRFAHLFGSPGQPEMLAQIQAHADRNIRRFKLMDEEA
jgi:pyruvate ferredoxin oxidoreductase beta subunit